jgi:hypothetical protein
MRKGPRNRASDRLRALPHTRRRLPRFRPLGPFASRNYPGRSGDFAQLAPRDCRKIVRREPTSQRRNSAGRDTNSLLTSTCIFFARSWVFLALSRYVDCLLKTLTLCSGTASAPNWYLYLSDPRRKSKYSTPLPIALFTSCPTSTTPGDILRAAGRNAEL